MPAQWEGRDLRARVRILDIPRSGSGVQTVDVEVEQWLWPSSKPDSTPASATAAPETEDKSAASHPALPRRLRLSWYAVPGHYAPAQGKESPAENAGAAPSTTEGTGGAKVAALPSPEKLEAGQRWEWELRAKAGHGNANPHGFDYELWLWSQGIGASGYVRNTRAAQMQPRYLGRDCVQNPIACLRQWAHSRIYAKLSANPQAAGIVAALAIGEQSAIAKTDWETLRRTGVAHLLSVSGLHITMFYWFMAQLIAWGWCSAHRSAWGWRPYWWMRIPAPVWAQVGGTVVAALYALVTGWGIPAQRTILMLVLASALRLAGLDWPRHVFYIVCMALVLLVDPWAWMQAGFWLSFIAVAILFTRPNSHAEDPHQRTKIAHHDPPSNANLSTDPSTGHTPSPPLIQPKIAAALGTRLYALLREQAVLSITLAPLTLVLFQQASVVGVLANIAAIPWVSFVLTPLALLGLALPPLLDLAAWSANNMMLLLNWCAYWPWAQWTQAAVPWPIGTLAIAGALLLAFSRGWPPSVRAACAGLMLPLFLWRPAPVPQGEFRIWVTDIGQGSAILVQTAQHSLLHDAGPSYHGGGSAGERILVPLLRALAVQPDAVLLSHNDADHVGGAEAILASLQTQAENPTPPIKVYGPWPTRSNCHSGQTWQWDGVRFRVLYPSPTALENMNTAKPRDNSASCVLEIDNGRQRALLTGDIEAAQEQALVASGVFDKRIDLLMVPHHGSKTSSSAALLAASQARLAVIQAGYRNRYQHPHPDVVKRYREHGIVLRNTSDCGALRWDSTAQSAASKPIYQCQRETETRYWQHRPSGAMQSKASNTDTNIATDIGTNSGTNSGTNDGNTTAIDTEAETGTAIEATTEAATETRAKQNPSPALTILP